MSACHRWILAALVVALVTVVSVYAGDENRPEKLARLKTELNLTDAQVDQFDQKFDVLDQVIERAQAIKAEIREMEACPDTDPKAVHARKVELETLKKEFNEQVTSIFRSVLTKEQFARWEAQQAGYKKTHSAKK
jgi:HAMP domain-containing protein